MQRDRPFHFSTSASLLALSFIGLGARLGGIFLIVRQGNPMTWEYGDIARTMLERGYFGFALYGGQPVPSSFMPPLYPFFLSLLYWFSPDHFFLATLVAQSMLSVINIYVTYLLAKAFTGNERIGLVAALASALYPAFIAGALQVNTITWEVLLVQLAAYLLLRWRGTGRPAFMLGGAVSLGLLALTRAPILLALPLLLPWLYREHRPASRPVRLQALLLFLLFVALPIAPWTWRNYAVHGQLVAISTNGGLNFWIGNNPKATGEWDHPTTTNPDLFYGSSSLTETQRDNLYYKEGLAFIFGNPGKFVQLLAAKAFYFWWFRPGLGSSYAGAGDVYKAAESLLMGSYGAVLLLAVPGLVVAFQHRQDLPLMGAVTFAYMASSMLYFTATRFRAPLEPFLIILAAQGLMSISTRFLPPGVARPGSHV